MKHIAYMIFGGQYARPLSNWCDTEEQARDAAAKTSWGRDYPEFVGVTDDENDAPFYKAVVRDCNKFLETYGELK